ncbi:MAG TPA: ATP-binding cassette domain-containing protein [Hyphomicrobiaceae bacterium]|nr:ATP-binding cassette domain-containing protein [Hyphomicrobiaceae bacterium]
MPALVTRDLSYRYGRRPALERVSLQVQPGRFTALLGPNGAGKTTLFSLVTRLLEPPAGAVTILGRDLVAAGSRALAEVGVVFQLPTLDLDLTVAQNLAYFAALHGLDRKTAAERIDRELAALGMGGSRTERVRTLSSGQRRRIEIARALLHRPRLLLLDEPTVGLDIPTRRGIVDHAHALAAEAGVAVLWATHLIDEIRDADHLIVLDKGRVVASGEAQAVVRRTAASSLGEAFDKLTAPGSEAP